MRARKGFSGCCEVSMTESAPSCRRAAALASPRHTATTLAPIAFDICTTTADISILESEQPPGMGLP